MLLERHTAPNAPRGLGNSKRNQDPFGTCQISRTVNSERLRIRRSSCFAHHLELREDDMRVPDKLKDEREDVWRCTASISGSSLDSSMQSSVRYNTIKRLEFVQQDQRGSALALLLRNSRDT